MPIYEFQCPSCGARFERLLPMSAPGEQPCPCGGVAGKRVTNVAFHGASPVPADVDAVPLRRRLPSSLQGVGGTRDGVAHFQRMEERLARFEDRNPEFRDEKMPVVSHENGRIVRATAKKEPAPSAPATPASGTSA